MASHRGATWQWRDEEAQEDDEDDSAGKEEENSEEDRESSGEDENENEKDSKRQKSDDADLPLYLRVRNKELDSEIASSGTTRTRKLRKLKKLEATHQIKKLHKNAPAVMPSNKPVRRLRVDADNSVKKTIDPRFSELSGKLNTDIFTKSYQFLDEDQEKEIAVMEKKLAKAKSPHTKEQLREELRMQKQQMAERRRAAKVRERLNETARLEREKVNRGIKKPFFLKESAKKQIALDVRYEELKETGKLNSFMNKKRKRNSSKDHRRVPRRRDE